MAEAVSEPVAEAPAEVEAPAKPARTRRKKAEAAPVEAAPEPAGEAEPGEEADEAPAAANDAGEAQAEAGPPRRGWWQRTFGE